MSRFQSWSAAFVVLLLICAYVGSTATGPLFTGNQNTYFPHGLARAGYFLLGNDFFARTTDPFPLFSSLVAHTHRWLGDGFFHLYLAILQATFLVGLLGISSHFTRTSTTSTESLATATAFIWSTSVLASKGHALLGFSPAVVAGSGLAQQSTPGSVFQPSSFGALLAFAVWLFLAGRRNAAAVAVAVAVAFHPTYAIAGASLVTAFMTIAFLERRRPREPLIIGGVALALVLPVVAYGAIHFAPTSEQTWLEATRYLARVRIPHHTQLLSTLGVNSVLQLSLVGTAIVIAMRAHARNGLLLLIPAAIATLLTALQLALGSDTLALLFPWRTSVLLVPVSFVIVVQSLARWAFARWPRDSKTLRALIATLCILSLLPPTLYGVTITERRFAHRETGELAALTGYVRRHMRAGDQYLVPLGLKEFRLRSGAPTFVDWKSHPLKDSEVLEWRRRIRLARRAYRFDYQCKVIGHLRGRAELTHVVVRSDRLQPHCTLLREVYRNPRYVLYAVDRAPARPLAP